MLRSEDIGDPEGGTGEGPVQVAQPTTNNGGNGSNRGQTPADSVPLIPVHPLGVKPLGNQYFSSVVPARRSLGQLVALPDEMILQILESLQAHDLLNVGVSCVFLFAFSRLDELWKSLYLEPFVCSHINLDDYALNIPKENQIQRFGDLAYADFAEGLGDEPFVLSGCIQEWPILKHWTIDEIRRLHPDTEFRAEAVDWPFSKYHEYLLASDDESPLYLFDKNFVEKMGIRVGRSKDAAYWEPAAFGDDLFHLLGAERPAHRWLIIGPKRSGSTFHKDPNGTSAWNAVIQGSKYWIMFPPTARVPGVYVSADSSEVTSPLSIAEWLLAFHAEARKQPGCVEGVCQAGEILHVPSGWWHLVVNLEAGVAVTQNFVPKLHLADVLSFLKDKPDQVTGFRRYIDSPYELFVERLQNSRPDVLEAAVQEMKRREGSRKRRWEDAVGATGNRDGDGGFSFGFGVEGDGDDTP